MEKPRITWLVRRGDEENFTRSPEFHAGVYSQQEDMILFLQIWNNRYGTEAVKSLEDFGIAVTFDKEEDSALLKYLRFRYGQTVFEPVISGNTGVIHIPDYISLSGAVNDGSDENIENYIVLQLSLAVPPDVQLKLNDLKAMTFSITNL